MSEKSVLLVLILLASIALVTVASEGFGDITCESYKCSNAGTCWKRDGITDAYRCVCSPGFTGSNCEININECASNPCINGRCIDGVNSYSCSCYSGWEGSNCDINHNDCVVGACLNNGRCIDGVATYTCDCLGTGFTGPRCEVNIDDCLPNPCKNGATCQDLVKDYSCKCFDGYCGKNCSSEMQDCKPHKCKFQGLCLERSNKSSYENPSLPPPFNGSFSYAQAAGFVCVCPVGTFGDTCEINPNDCLIPGTDQRVCVHASSCTDGLASFTCHCLPGFEGPTCSINIKECQMFGQPCQNGAVCKDLIADYACTNCPAGFGGKNCSVELPSFSFGVGGRTSLASFSNLSNISRMHVEDSWTIDMRLMTLSPGAFLMLLGDPSDSSTTPRLLVTIDSTGRLLAQLLHSNGSQVAALTSSDSVATGSFVTVKISVSISGRELSLAVSSAVRSASLSSASPLSQLSGQLIIGGLGGAPVAPAPSLSHNSRSKRSIATIPASIVSHLQPNITAFRGVIAAALLNENWPLILGSVAFSLIDSLPRAVVADMSVEVVTGIVKENPCEAIRPCENGATCVDGSYYSYSCTCHSGFSGANCSVDIPDCNPNPCGANSYCLERSKAAFYGNAALPPPFSGSFSYSSAAGFVCLPIYEGGKFTQWKVVAISLAAFSVGVLLSIAVFLLLLSRHRNGRMSFGYFERQRPAAKNTEAESAPSAPDKIENQPSTHGAHAYVTADKLVGLSNTPAADVYGMDPYDEANDAEKNLANATADKAVDSPPGGIGLVESDVGLSAYDEIPDLTAGQQQQQHRPKPRQRGDQQGIGTEGGRPEQLTVDEVGSGDGVSMEYTSTADSSRQRQAEA